MLQLSKVKKRIKRRALCFFMFSEITMAREVIQTRIRINQILSHSDKSIKIPSTGLSTDDLAFLERGLRDRTHHILMIDAQLLDAQNFRAFCHKLGSHNEKNYTLYYAEALSEQTLEWVNSLPSNIFVRQATQLDDLPYEISLHILNMLEPASRITVGRVNRLFYKLSRDKHNWRNKFLEDYPQHSELTPEVNYRLAYLLFSQSLTFELTTSEKYELLQYEINDPSIKLLIEQVLLLPREKLTDDHIFDFICFKHRVTPYGKLKIFTEYWEHIAARFVTQAIDKLAKNDNTYLYRLLAHLDAGAKLPNADTANKLLIAAAKHGRNHLFSKLYSIIRPNLSGRGENYDKELHPTLFEIIIAANNIERCEYLLNAVLLFVGMESVSTARDDVLFRDIVPVFLKSKKIDFIEMMITILIEKYKHRNVYRFKIVPLIYEHCDIDTFCHLLNKEGYAGNKRYGLHSDSNTCADLIVSNRRSDLLLGMLGRDEKIRGKSRYILFDDLVTTTIKKGNFHILIQLIYIQNERTITRVSNRLLEYSSVDSNFNSHEKINYLVAKYLAEECQQNTEFALSITSFKALLEDYLNQKPKKDSAMERYSEFFPWVKKTFFCHHKEDAQRLLDKLNEGVVDLDGLKKLHNETLENLNEAGKPSGRFYQILLMFKALIFQIEHYDRSSQNADTILQELAMVREENESAIAASSTCR